MRRIFIVGVAVLTVTMTLVLPSTSASAATSPIDQRYLSDQVLATRLGPSKGAEFTVASGREHDYRNGALFWSSVTGVYFVLNDLLGKYKSIGGPVFAGFPITDEAEQWLSNRSQVGSDVNLQKGSIEWVFGIGPGSEPPHYIPAAIFAEYLAMHGVIGPGVPQSDGITVAHRGMFVEFSVGQIYWSASTGARYVRGAISDKHLELNGAEGFLGLPIEEGNLATTNDGLSQAFQGGAIYAKFDMPAHEVHGGIRKRFNSEGGLSRLGYPLTDELWTSYGRKQRFEHGEIQWQSATGVTKVINR